MKQSLKWLAWLPFAFGSVGLAIALLVFNLKFGLFLATMAAGLGVLWLIGRRRWTQAIVFCGLLSPLVWSFAIDLPAPDILAHCSEEKRLAIEGTIRDRWDALDDRGDHIVGLLLGEVRIFQAQQSWPLPEVAVEFPEHTSWNFTAGRSLRLAGSLRRVHTLQQRLSISLADADWHFMAASYDPHGFDALRTRLTARAAFYLNRYSQAVYLPLVLDLRDRQSPEGRDVISTFRRVGISHLFAISGLNIAMIFGLLMVIQRYVTWVLAPGQGWIHGRTVARIAIVGLIWVYIALIGFPVTAVRAAVMGSMVIWTELWGTRTSPLYVLLLTGLSMLSVAPSALYDISFQLSFLAYFFLVEAMTLGRVIPKLAAALVHQFTNRSLIRLPERQSGGSQGEGPMLARFWHKLLRFCAENLWVTGIVTLGLWPIMADRFHNLSLLVFAGNLLLVPAMELALLPVAMLALTVSAVCASAAPDVWVERLAFGALQVGLSLWVQAVHLLDRVGGNLTLKLNLQWSVWEFIGYYGALLGALRGPGLLSRWVVRRTTGKLADGRSQG